MRETRSRGRGESQWQVGGDQWGVGKAKDVECKRERERVLIRTLLKRGGSFKFVEVRGGKRKEEKGKGNPTMRDTRGARSLTGAIRVE